MSTDSDPGKFQVCFVSSSTSPEVSRERLNLAFHAMQEAQLDPIQIPSEECLLITTKEPKLFVMDPFEGDVFKHLVSVRSRIVGPLCILQCLQLGDTLPKRPHPVFSVSMRHVTVTCSNMAKLRRNDITRKVEYMGGLFSKDLTKSVTHLVVTEVGSKKYHVATNVSLPIMLPEWIDSLWEEGQYKQLHANDSCYDKFKCPIFKGLVITVSQLSLEERQAVSKIVEEHGGIYLGALKQKQTTHLILSEPTGEKYRFAKTWNIFCVTISWIYDSVKAGYSKEESLYALDETSQPPPQRSTPKMDKSTELPLVECSAISTNCAVSHLDETSQSDVSLAIYKKPGKTNSWDAIDVFNVTTEVQNCGQFLDGCKIFLTGLSPLRQEKLRKIVNAGGGMRFSKYSDSITHVVCGDLSDEMFSIINSNSVKPHVVSYQWLLESCSKKTLLDEKPFLCMKPSTLSPQKMEKPSHEKEVHIDVSQKDDVEVQDNISNIFSQYMMNNANEVSGASNKDDISTKLDDISTKQLDNAIEVIDVENAEMGEPEVVVLDAQNETETESESCEQISQLFKGKTFVIVGFAEKDDEILSNMIKLNSGEIISTPSTANVAIVPLIWDTLDLQASQVVTNCWLQKCIEEDRLLGFDDNELFSPFDISFTVDKPFKDFVISVSQYSGTERDCLMHLAGTLGATCQEFFVRKVNKARGVLPNTHLIVSSPEGSKYEASKKWKIPAVTKHWVIDAAKFGIVPDMAKYLVDNPKPVQSKIPAEPKPCVEDAKPFVITLEANEDENIIIEDVVSNDSKTPKPVSIEQSSDSDMAEPLNLDQPYKLNLHLSGLLSDSPDASNLSRKRKSSVSLGEMFGRNLSLAIQNIKSAFKRESDAAAESTAAEIATQPPTKSRVLQGVTVCVARKLANLQNELNELVGSLGGDYLWTYDSSCTHFVFQGKTNDLSKEFRQAKSQNKIIVSPDWVYACAESDELLSEKLYPHTLKSRMSLTGQISLSKKCETPTQKETKCIDKQENANHAGNSSENVKTPTKQDADFNKQLNELLVAAKSAKRSRSKRKLESISIDLGNQSINLPPPELRHTTSDTKKIPCAIIDDGSSSQASQMYPITWDDPTGRQERERIAAMTQKNIEREEAICDVDQPSPSPRYRKFMFTNIPESEKSKYSAIITKLGGELSTEKSFDATATHLILEQPLKNEKFLASLASGKWILHPKYLIASEEQNCFVDEEEYEWGGPSTSSFIQAQSRSVSEAAVCPYRWRTKIQEMGNCGGAFYGWVVILFVDDRSKLSTFTKILEAGQGKVFLPSSLESALKSATHIFVEMKKKSNSELNFARFVSQGIKCLKANFLAYYLIDDPPPPIEDFLLPQVKELMKSSESNSKRSSDSSALNDGKKSRLR